MTVIAPRLAASLGAPLAETIAEAFANLNAHRQRSLLALLGILIGSASIVAMLTIGHMAQRETLKLFAHMGVDILSIHAQPAGDQVARLDRRAIETLPGRVGGVLTAAPFASDRTSAEAGNQSADVGIAAVTPALGQVISLRMDRGRFIAPVDDDSLVAVVGSETAEKLSAPGAPLVPGSQVRVKGYVFTVIGTLAPVPFTALDPTVFNIAVVIPLAGAPGACSPRPIRTPPSSACGQGPTPRRPASRRRRRWPTPPPPSRCRAPAS